MKKILTIITLILITSSLSGCDFGLQEEVDLFDIEHSISDKGELIDSLILVKQKFDTLIDENYYDSPHSSISRLKEVHKSHPLSGDVDHKDFLLDKEGIINLTEYEKHLKYERYKLNDMNQIIYKILGAIDSYEEINYSSNNEMEQYDYTQTIHIKQNKNSLLIEYSELYHDQVTSKKYILRIDDWEKDLHVQTAYYRQFETGEELNYYRYDDEKTLLHQRYRNYPNYHTYQSTEFSYKSNSYSSFSIFKGLDKENEFAIYNTVVDGKEDIYYNSFQTNEVTRYNVTKTINGVQFLSILLDENEEITLKWNPELLNGWNNYYVGPPLAQIKMIELYDNTTLINIDNYETYYVISNGYEEMYILKTIASDSINNDILMLEDTSLEPVQTINMSMYNDLLTYKDEILNQTTFEDGEVVHNDITLNDTNLYNYALETYLLDDLYTWIQEQNTSVND